MIIIQTTARWSSSLRRLKESLLVLILDLQKKLRKRAPPRHAAGGLSSCPHGVVWHEGSAGGIVGDDDDPGRQQSGTEGVLT